MGVNNKYQKLLSPGYIGSVKTRNRIIKSGSGLVMVHEDDVHMREEMKALYESHGQRAASASSSRRLPPSTTLGATRLRRRYRIDDDKYIEGLKELVDVIHKHDCPTFMQMNHDGPWQPTLTRTPYTRGPRSRPRPCP